MPELSLQHIEQIAKDISKQEISFSHLLEDLIDHVCCDVEDEMQTGLTFSDAYSKVKQKATSKRFKEIQEETLYAVDTKYRYMKNTMKISGIAGSIMLGFAAIFKILHYPGAGILMTLGALTLSFVFMPSALGVLWKETHSKKRLSLFISAFIAGTFYIMGMLFKIQHWPIANTLIFLAVVSGVIFFIPSLLVSKLLDQENKSKRAIYLVGAFGLVFYSIGFLFKILHWPYAWVLMFMGSFILFAITLPWYTWKTWKDEKHITSQFLFMLLASLLFIVPSALVNVSLQRSYEDGFFAQQEQQLALFNYEQNANQVFLSNHKDLTSYPVMEQLSSKTKDLLNLINGIEIKMINESEGSTPSQIKLPNNSTEIQYRFLTQAFMTDQVKQFLVPGSTSRQELDAALAGYRSYLITLTTDKDAGIYSKLLDPSTYLPGQNPPKGDLILISGLHSLLLLKNSLLIAELYGFKEIAKR